LEQRDFIDCINERRRPLSDGFAGLQVVELLELAQKSLVRDGIALNVGGLVDVANGPLGSGHDRVLSARHSHRAAIAAAIGEAS
jgi:hypothetical protein